MREGEGSQHRRSLSFVYVLCAHVTDLSASPDRVRFVRSHKSARALDEFRDDAARHVGEIAVRIAAARRSSSRRVILRHCLNERQHAHERAHPRTSERCGRQLRPTENGECGAVLQLHTLRRTSVIATS